MQTKTSDLSTIFEALPDLVRAGQLLIERAYERAREAHEGQFRHSGEPYIRHCLAVAQILADMKLDATTIAAALLHDVVEDTGVTKMKQIPTGVDGMYAGKAGDREMEYLRKMLLAMASDFRVMLIKLADRLHNMRTLGHMPAEKQQVISRETLDIFSPIANRLGIWQLKWQLEDLSFRYLNPVAYRAIREQRLIQLRVLLRLLVGLRPPLSQQIKLHPLPSRPVHLPLKQECPRRAERSS